MPSSTGVVEWWYTVDVSYSRQFSVYMVSVSVEADKFAKRDPGGMSLISTLPEKDTP